MKIIIKSKNNSKQKTALKPQIMGYINLIKKLSKTILQKLKSIKVIAYLT